MTWAGFYLLVFLVGLGLVAASLLLGAFHDLGFGGHGSGIGGPDLGASGHGFAGGHDLAAGTHAGGGYLSPGDAGAGAGGEGVQPAGASPFNLMTVAAFLLWFGGAGYIVNTLYPWLAYLVLLVAAASGLVGGTAVFYFLARVLVRGTTRMDPSEYRLVGTVGRLSIGIREGGIGEILYVQGGTRKSLGARSLDGRAIPRDTEVVIVAYQKGLAVVRPWEEYLEENKG
ncbi:MAG: hypothetical protein M1299_09095 [Firmicutes bacterium]|nr:hypothetical protein [Bacillota bacterium]MCL5039961.1 hypothetical protein [Bacillota bacterium]